MPEPRGNKVRKKWDQECKRGCKNKRMPRENTSGKGSDEEEEATEARECME